MIRLSTLRVLSISLALAIVFTSLVSLVSAPTVTAASFTIPDGDVAGLIDAINTANANGQPDTIELATGGMYVLMTTDNIDYGDNGLPTITSEITIKGNGATITRSISDEADHFRILNINGGNLTLDRVTISNGWSLQGGGIFIFPGQVNLINSTVTGNHAADGGGIHASGGSTLSIVNSTISNNSATFGAGGLRFWTSATIINSTISGNTAGNDGGAGFRTAGGAIPTLINTIVAGNTTPHEAVDIRGVVQGTHNLIGIGTGFTGMTNGVDSNQIGTTADPIDPLLGLLADNGGTTHTHALLPGSPAIDAGTSTNATPLTDQRGEPRPNGVANDIGAYEFNVTYALLCKQTQVVVSNPILARTACASLILAQRAEQANNTKVEHLALTLYRFQIRIGMAFRAISATDGQNLLDWSNRIN